jgi:Skp family chaperone for outer membrane proteins
VFQNEQVVWASPRIDITDKVIKALGTQADK